MVKMKGKIKMQIEYFKTETSGIELEKFKNEVNCFINDLHEDGLKCIDVQFIYCEKIS